MGDAQLCELAAAPLSRRVRGALLAAYVVDCLPVWANVAKPAELPKATALHALDRSAYASGMWWQMVKARDPDALRPRSVRPVGHLR